MIVKIVMLLCLMFSGYEDIREQQIHVLPVLLCMVFGIIVRIGTVNFTGSSIVFGALPGIISFILGKICQSSIGEGDSLWILCVGVLNGFWFCISFLGITFTLVFLFSAVMMWIGKLHRKSQVACVPFMVFGYLGAWLL